MSSTIRKRTIYETASATISSWTSSSSATPTSIEHALTPKGDYIPIGHAHYDNRTKPILGDMPRFLGLLFKAMRDPEKRKNFKIPKKAEALEIFRDLLAAGKVTPVIGRTFALSEVVAAMKCMQEGQIGRMIITP